MPSGNNKSVQGSWKRHVHVSKVKRVEKLKANASSSSKFSIKNGVGGTTRNYSSHLPSVN